MRITDPEILPHWSYFLSLEEDVIRLARWVEFAEANFQCYSIEIARLFMAACSEVDVVAKLVCNSISPGIKVESINGYQSVIVGEYPAITKGVTSIPRYGIELTPWSDWELPKSPPAWWKANNKVKHHRSEHFPQASLINLLNSMAGLLILVTLLYRDKVNQLYPLTELFIPRAFLLRMAENQVMFNGRV